MRIAIDAMGGDHAPQEIVRGAALFLEQYEQGKILLFGDEALIKKEINGSGLKDFGRVEIIHTTQVVGMHEPPVQALKTKSDSSIARAVGAVKDHDADAVISMGNTGVMVAACTLRLRTLQGISRPGIAVPVPTPKGPCMTIDMGGSVDSRPEHLISFAIMASVYCQSVMKKENPTVGLLSIGEEDSKGNALAKETNALLKLAPINFYGNIEGQDILRGTTDIVVCDGFVGNVVLKVTEGAGDLFMRTLNQLVASEMGPEFYSEFKKKIMQKLLSSFDYAEYGGANLMGVNGVCIVGHGKSDARAVCNSLRVAAESVEQNVNQHIISEMASYSQKAVKLS